MSIRVLLADDSEIIRSAIVGILKRDPNIELVGEAGTFTDCLTMAVTLKPDVLLLDLHMRDDSRDPHTLGSELAMSVRRIIGISLAIDDGTNELAASLGASILLDKADLARTLLPTISSDSAI